MADDDEEIYLPEEDELGEIIHWYERPPMHLSAVQATGATLAAFGLGALAAVGILALMGRIRD